jgi:hypothetical protein
MRPFYALRANSAITLTVVKLQRIQAYENSLLHSATVDSFFSVLTEGSIAGSAGIYSCIQLRFVSFFVTQNIYYHGPLD